MRKRTFEEAMREFKKLNPDSLSDEPSVKNFQTPPPTLDELVNTHLDLSKDQDAPNLSDGIAYAKDAYLIVTEQPKDNTPVSKILSNAKKQESFKTFCTGTEYKPAFTKKAFLSALITTIANNFGVNSASIVHNVLDTPEVKESFGDYKDIAPKAAVFF